MVKGTGTGTFDFSVVSPDHLHNSSDTITFPTLPVDAATEANVTLDQSKDYTLRIDTNSDGTVDSQVQPESIYTKYIDLTPPADTTDLAVTSVTSGSANLLFTAPGDDANSGIAQYYDIRYSTAPISEASWKEAIPIEQVPAPLLAGLQVTATATGLNAGTTYYFAMKSKDEALLASHPSNIATANTTIPSLTWAKKRIYWASWADYQNRQLSLDYTMGNAGTGISIAAKIAASYANPTSVYVTTPLPLMVGDVSPNSSGTVTLKYYVPTSVGSFTTTTYANCKDDASRTYGFPGQMP